MSTLTETLESLSGGSGVAALPSWPLCRQGCARSSSEGLYSRDVGVKRRELWVDD